ncbi:MAG: hypothetical protein H6555_11925 [Lewinellaceae bacterium]|nr:hypothetical protein [Lewinellaceae bacterium]
MDCFKPRERRPNTSRIMLAASNTGKPARGVSGRSAAEIPIAQRIEGIYHEEGRFYNLNVDVNNTSSWRKEYTLRDHFLPAEASAQEGGQCPDHLCR